MGRGPMTIDPSIDLGGDMEFRAVVLLAHPELYVKLSNDSIVVDPWRQHKSSSYKVIHYGNTRESF